MPPKSRGRSQTCHRKQGFHHNTHPYPVPAVFPRKTACNIFPVFLPKSQKFQPGNMLNSCSFRSDTQTLKVTRNSAQNTTKCSGFGRRRCEENITGNTARKHANYAVHRLSESALSTKSDPCRVPAVSPRKMHRNRGTEGSHQLSRFHVGNGGIPGWKPAEFMLFSIWVGKCRTLQKSVPKTQ